MASDSIAFDWYGRVPGHLVISPGRRRCPTCTGRLLPILYGLPSHEAFLKAKQGKCVLGGCEPEPFDRKCAGCGAKFVRRPADRGA
jgi:hypothetical protein